MKTHAPSETVRCVRKAGLVVAQLALEPDRAGDPGGDQQPQQCLGQSRAQARSAATATSCAAVSVSDAAGREVEQRVEQLA